MTESTSEQGNGRDQDDGPMSVPDEQLPDDVRPGEDNPLAQPAGEDVPDDILKDTHEDRPGHDSSGGSEGVSKGGGGGSDDTDAPSTETSSDAESGG
jgi:hypothetical protein